MIKYLDFRFAFSPLPHGSGQDEFLAAARARAADLSWPVVWRDPTVDNFAISEVHVNPFDQ
jgi:hypothetical protein